MSKDKLKPAEKRYIVAKIFFEEKNIIFFQGNFYLYNEGIWRAESYENTEAWIFKEYMRKHSEPPASSTIKEIVKIIQHFTYNQYRKEIKYLLEHTVSNSINVEAGVLDLRNYGVTPYTKEAFAFHKLPFNYIENPSCPVLMRYLSTSMGFGWPLEDGIENLTKNESESKLEDYKKVMQFIQEWMGYTLMPGNPFEKALIMTGRGRNGKGTLLHIWSEILGKANISTLGLDGINNERMIHMTMNKLANLALDSNSNSQLDSEVVKRAVVGEEVQANPKYDQPFTFNFTAKLILACNDLPFTRSTDENVRERFYVLPFDQQFSEAERDPQLKQKLSAEAEQIFSWAVNGLKRLKKRGHFVVPDRCKTSLNEFLVDNDTIEQWLIEEDRKDPEATCKRSDAWRGYKYYCHDAGTKPYKKSKWTNQMRKKGYGITMKNGEYYFIGIKKGENDSQ